MRALRESLLKRMASPSEVKNVRVDTLAF